MAYDFVHASGVLASLRKTAADASSFISESESRAWARLSMRHTLKARAPGAFVVFSLTTLTGPLHAFVKFDHEEVRSYEITTDEGSVTLAVFLFYSGSIPPGLQCTALPCVVGYASDGKIYDENALNAPGWGDTCCIYARMTTIAQAPVNVFNDGSMFGLIYWSDANLHWDTAPPYGIIAGSLWSGGGFQSWPDGATRIIVTQLNRQQREADTIDLHS